MTMIQKVSRAMCATYGDKTHRNPEKLSYQADYGPRPEWMKWIPLAQLALGCFSDMKATLPDDIDLDDIARRITDQLSSVDTHYNRLFTQRAISATLIKMRQDGSDASLMPEVIIHNPRGEPGGYFPPDSDAALVDVKTETYNFGSNFTGKLHGPPIDALRRESYRNGLKAALAVCSDLARHRLPNLGGDNTIIPHTALGARQCADLIEQMLEEPKNG